MTHPRRRDRSATIDRNGTPQLLEFIDRQRLDAIGRHRNADGCTQPTLYSSAYAAMFPSWFRLLSLALTGKALPGHVFGAVP